MKKDLNINIMAKLPKRVKVFNLKTYLQEHDFFEDVQMKDEFEDECRSDLMMRYVGMGHCIVIGCNPTISRHHCYFIGALGGPNGYEAQSNDKEFRAIGNPGTRYYTEKEICEWVPEENLYQKNSSPLVQN